MFLLETGGWYDKLGCFACCDSVPAETGGPCFVPISAETGGPYFVHIPVETGGFVPIPARNWWLV